jgi:hypothetical protein
MKTFLICLGIIWIIGGIVMLYHILTAPIGYEDEDGFHYDKNEDKK